jgi:bifunctional UDP-N-acetylglucosamine pyrophosphorylase/glucosamine-1-phosphate N-acetyltransferase
MKHTSIKTAIILAAGPGTRFWPYNIVRQKAAFPIANVPLIRRLADDLWKLGLSRIIVVVGVGEASIRAALRGVEIAVEYVKQAEPTGTAPAILAGAANLDEPLLVLPGDIATNPQNLAGLITAFEQQAPLAATLIQPLGQENPRDWISAYPDGEQLRGVEGHSRDGQYRLCGVTVLQPATLSFLRDNPGLMTHVPVGGMPPLEAEAAQSIQMMIDEGESVLAVETSGYHVDLDKPWHILEANQQVITAMQQQVAENIIPASSHIHDSAEISGRVVMGENAVIGNRVVIRGDVWLGEGASITNGAILEGPVVVGAQTKIRDYALIGGHTSLGGRGVYGHGAEFSGLALEKVYCYHYCEVWGVVGQAVDFGAATVCGNLRFDDGDTTWRVKGRPETPTTAANAAYFGDFCRTGVNAIIMPGRRIGVYACVGPGVVAYDDVPDGEMLMLKQELIKRPWGPERYGW